MDVVIKLKNTLLPITLEFDFIFPLDDLNTDFVSLSSQPPTTRIDLLLMRGMYVFANQHLVRLIHQPGLHQPLAVLLPLNLFENAR